MFGELSDTDRQVLARWAGKTAIVESYAVGAECPVDRKYLRWMREHEDGVGRFAVAGCKTRTQAFSHLQAGIIRDLIGGGKVAGNIILIGLPTLALACAFAMIETRYECKCVRSAFYPLWPHQDAWRDMDQTDLPKGLSDLEELTALSERIEIYHPLR